MNSDRGAGCREVPRPRAVGVCCRDVLILSGVDVRFVSAAQNPSPSAEADVRDTLQRYSAALESLDADAVKKVQPSIPAESLAKAFRDMRELDVTIDMIRVLSLDGATARVSCRVTQTLTPRAGAKRTTTVTRVMRLKRNPDVWIIDGFER